MQFYQQPLHTQHVVCFYHNKESFTHMNFSLGQSCFNLLINPLTSHLSFSPQTIYKYMTLKPLAKNWFTCFFLGLITGSFILFFFLVQFDKSYLTASYLIYSKGSIFSFNYIQFPTTQFSILLSLL